MHRPLISYLATGVTGMVVALSDAPWWQAAAAFGCLALGLGVVALQSVFPQESAHRLAWWRDRRR
ncbi:hypothetical protein ACIBWG_32460 [Streptomyces griseoaurantiacus]|uniref:hypothetical protein n=1 Tax=Streptomyces TaxID=1883 RepID=UPI0029BB5A9D|nr:hypothetical protein [Streptomyces sp. ME02-6978.2a]MDX3364088.1 hypothetical protein [Streptomyces sp. ME02-6978.2a]